MLRRTFLHVPGIGLKTECKLWQKGVLSWSQFVQRRRIPGFSRSFVRRYREYLFDSKEALERGDIDYFANKLPKREWWRLYSEFRDHAAFLDIETTGLSRYYDDVTIIGLFNGENVKIFVQNQNLEDFLKEIQKYSVLVTFNGSLFDLPFLREKFHSLRLPFVHIDLRYFLRRLGYKGGLKAVEEKFGMTREKEVQEIDGFGATVLWNRYLRGNVDALKLLVSYNIADTLNLKTLIERGCRLMEKRLLRHPRISNYDTEIVEGPYVDVLKKDEVSFDLLVKGNESFPIDLRVNRKGRMHIDMLLSKFENTASYPRVVGIDLSASEKRRTGWALLKGKSVETKLVKTDREIVDATVEANPDLISIDSPLSLPKGRDCTSDSCECRKFGIMREAERILRSRGVYIFPSLIPSMQPLTERGIRMRKEFERRGFSVIESYPGAAQDILRIIRKKVSKQDLKQGLENLGLIGEFEKERNSHHELDAITSALVGYFYLIGEYEALGNEEEDYLIIPKVTRTSEM